MIGDRIRALREARSWTQAHLAEAAGVSLRTIQRLETVHSCSRETLLALASALQVDVRELTRELAAPDALPPERLLWEGPAVRKAAFWGGLLALPSLLFVVVNLLKYGLGLAAPYDALAGAGAAVGLVAAFDWASPVILLGGPLVAFALNLAALFRPRIRSDEQGVAVTALAIRFDTYGLAVMLAALACLGILAAYLVGETLTHLVRVVKLP